MKKPKTNRSGTMKYALGFTFSGGMTNIAFFVLILFGPITAILTLNMAHNSYNGEDVLLTSYL